MRAWFRGAVTAAYASGIFALSSSARPLGLEPPPLPGLDKLLHGVEFGILALLLRWSLAAARWAPDPRGRDALAVTLAVVYGVSDELHQLLVPGRDASIWDALADAGGALLAIALARRLGAWRDLRVDDEGEADAATLRGR